MSVPQSGTVLVLICGSCQKRNRITFKLAQRYRCAACHRDFTWDDIKRAGMMRDMFGGHVDDILKALRF